MKILCLLAGLSASVFASEQLLEIYTNKAFLKQNIGVGSGEVSLKVPANLKMEELFFKTSCVINDKNFGELEAIDEVKSEKLQEDVKKLQKQIWETQTQISLYEKSSITAKNVQEVTANIGKILPLVSKLYDKKDSLSLDLQKARKAYVDANAKVVKPLNLTLTCKAPDVMELKYAVNNLNPIWQNKFDATSSEKRLEVTQSIIVENSLGFDLEGVSVRLLPFAFGQNIAPSPFYSLKIPQEYMMLRSSNAMMKDGVVNPLSTKRVYESANVTLKNKQKSQIIFNQQELSADFLVEVDGFASAKAYQKGVFTPNQEIESSNGVAVFDGLIVGDGYVEEKQEGKETQFYFGENDFVSVDKKEVEQMSREDKTQTTKSTQRLWQYEVVNLGKDAQYIELIERLPVSTDERYTIKRLGDKPAHMYEDGKVIYNMKLESGEKRVLEFGYVQTEPVK